MLGELDAAVIVWKPLLLRRDGTPSMAKRTQWTTGPSPTERARPRFGFGPDFRMVPDPVSRRHRRGDQEPDP